MITGIAIGWSGFDYLTPPLFEFICVKRIIQPQQITSLKKM